MAASAVDGASNTAVTNSVMCSLPSYSLAYVKAKTIAAIGGSCRLTERFPDHADVILSHETEVPHERSCGACAACAQRHSLRVRVIGVTKAAFI